MKYPEHTISQPLDRRQSKRVADAIDKNEDIINDRYRAAIRRIIKAKKMRENAEPTAKI